MTKLCQSLDRAEAEAKTVGISVPQAPMPQPLSGDPTLALVYAQELHERFFGWNYALLAIEAHLEPANPARKKARRAGRVAHAWYEESKPLYRDLGAQRVDPVIQAIYREAMVRSAFGDRIARRFLDWRNTHTPIVFGLPR